MNDVPKFVKDVPNFVKNVPNYMKDVPRVPNCVPRWESAPNHFFVGLIMKSCTIHVQMGDSKVIGSDIPNLKRMYQIL